MHRIRLFVISFLLVVSVATASAEQTSSVMAENVLVEQQWARATFPMAKTGAAYMTVSNIGDTALTLTGVSVSDSVAAMAQLHETVMQDTMMQMRELEHGVSIAPGQSVEFAPMGKHLMLMGLSRGLTAGDVFSVELIFADESILSVEFEVKDAR